VVIQRAFIGRCRHAAAREMMAKSVSGPSICPIPPHVLRRQRQRIAIAGGHLMHEPRIVVADEPVSALDVFHPGPVLKPAHGSAGEFRLAVLSPTIVRWSAYRRRGDGHVLVAGEQGTRRPSSPGPATPYTRALLASRPPSPESPGQAHCLDRRVALSHRSARAAPSISAALCTAECARGGGAAPRGWPACRLTTPRVSTDSPACDCDILQQSCHRRISRGRLWQIPGPMHPIEVHGNYDSCRKMTRKATCQ